MTKKPFIDELTDTLFQALPSHLQGIKDDAAANFKIVLQGAFNKLDLVTREEFDAQKKVLARSRQKIEALEAIVKKLELAD